jgi:hypothetical protein
VTRTQAVYYRDSRGTESADEFIQALPPKRAAKIHDFVEEHLTGNPPGAPLPAFPITSQIEGESPRASSPVRKHSLLHPVPGLGESGGALVRAREGHPNGP